MEISGGILKNDDISAAAFHRFISQPASGRSSALPCLAAILVLSEIWRLLRLHGLFFGTGNDHTGALLLLYGHFLLSPLEDVTQKMFFLQSLSKGFFSGDFFDRLKDRLAQSVFFNIFLYLRFCPVFSA